MKQSFFVQSVLLIDDNGLFVDVDMEKTNELINELMLNIQSQGFEIESITPLISGVGQYKCGQLQPKKMTLFKWSKVDASHFSYGFGYSYTSGFIILAKLADETVSDN